MSNQVYNCLLYLSIVTNTMESPAWILVLISVNRFIGQLNVFNILMYCIKCKLVYCNSLIVFLMVVIVTCNKM